MAVAQREIRIAFCVDQNYLMQAAVALRSVVETTSAIVHFHVLTTGVDDAPDDDPRGERERHCHHDEPELRRQPQGPVGEAGDAVEREARLRHARSGAGIVEAMGLV